MTFAISAMERVIEERCRGDASKADSLRASLRDRIGADIRSVKPGSEAATKLKAALIEDGLWSQYLEVAIGPDAEIFTKAPTLSSVGWGDWIGVRSDSAWNNPEPEIVLAVDSAGRILGATLGNDVNLRDIEGRSALLLGKAKDNNASCAIGPFIRMFDGRYTLDDVRNAVVRLEIAGDRRFPARRPELDVADQPRSRPNSSARPSASTTAIRTASRCSWERCSRRSWIAASPARDSRTRAAMSFGCPPRSSVC